VLIQLPVRLLFVAENRLSRVTRPTSASTTPKMSIRRAAGMLSSSVKRSGGIEDLEEELLGLRGRGARLTGSGAGLGSGWPRLPPRETGFM